MIRFQTCSSAFRHRSKAASELGRICLANRSQGNVNGIPHLPPQPGNYVDKCLWKFRHNMSGNIFFSGSVVHEDDSFPSAAAMDLYGCGCKGIKGALSAVSHQKNGLSGRGNSDCSYRRCPMSKLSARIFQHKRKRKIRRLT